MASGIWQRPSATVPPPTPESTIRHRVDSSIPFPDAEMDRALQGRQAGVPGGRVLARDCGLEWRCVRVRQAEPEHRVGLLTRPSVGRTDDVPGNASVYVTAAA